MSSANPDMLEIGQAIGAAWRALRPYDWPGIAAGLNRLDTLGPILEPTAYARSIHDGILARNQRMVAAALQFVDAMEQLKGEVEGE